MGRSPLIVKKDELQREVDNAEASKEFATLGELCKFISASPWGQGVKNQAWKVKGIQPQMVYVKINELGVTHKTKVGKRGRQPGQQVNKTARADRVACLPHMKGFRERFKNHILNQPVAKKYENMVDRVAKAEPKACVKMMCNECMGYEGTPAACTNLSCPIYPLNALYFPNRRKLVQDAEGIFYHTERQKEDETDD